ncbi:family 78 glycoside hydrolase catalytic domain [Pedobacter sp. Du54]|uniref:family 78 glycoside hydrolase catalytic domain n=1 Tax=Pedobacter anseongensis TaxID=3133439 RepID=UPI0030A43240
MSKLIVFSWLYFLSIPLFAQVLKVDELTCQYQVNPTGVETLNPYLSWKLKSKQNNVLQTAYQILVAENTSDLSKNVGSIWDSKKTNSKQSIQNKFKGKLLKAGKTYFWKVRIWDNKNNVSWSAISTWQMGLLTLADWKGANWIAYEKLADSNVNTLPTDGKKDKFNQNNILPLFRKEFEVPKTVKRATLFIAGLGHFEAKLNGQKIGDHFIDAGWTKYDKQALYVTFDLTKQIKMGSNALGVMLGNGFYYIPPVKGRYRKLKVAFGFPKMICKLIIEHNDGTKTTINSDQSWKTAPSPIIFSSIYGGEDYDANLEQKGWDNIGFKSIGWKIPLVVNGPPLNSQKEEPVKVFENFVAKTIQSLPNGDLVYDLGQNASGIIELKVKGKKGDTIRITPAELLKADGNVNQAPTGSPFYFTYILKGGGLETWRPQFTYYGFRYLQVKGALQKSQINFTSMSSKPYIEDLKGLHIRNAAKPVGKFSSSNDLFNKTFNLIDWAIKSNMVSLFTDCPHREKLGWLEELHLMGSSVRYNYDVALLFRKALQDMRNSQTTEGLIPEISPEYVKFEWGGDMFRDSPEWGSSGIIMPWYLYQWYGDKGVLADYYPMMKRYIAYLGTKAKDNILSQGLGDWYDLGPKPPGVSQLTPMGVTATAIYYQDLMILQQIAKVLGKTEEIKTYQRLATEVRKSFNQTFFNPTTKQYATGSQTANAMAVYMELVEPENKAAVVENIIKDIRNRNNSLTAGDIGYRYLLKVLENENRSDVIFDMNSRSDVPGYGMQIAKGATALTESWAALPTVSNNHFMLGHLMEWFYSGVGGIRQEKNSLGFNKIIIYPEVVGDLTSAKTSYDSPYGIIETEWIKTNEGLKLAVTIPANATATLYLPASITHQATNLGTASFTALGYENGRAKIGVGSGSYKFMGR